MRKTAQYRRFRRKYRPKVIVDPDIPRGMGMFCLNLGGISRERYDIPPRHEERDPVQEIRRCKKCGMVDGNVDYKYLKARCAEHGILKYDQWLEIHRDYSKRCTLPIRTHEMVIIFNCPRCQARWTKNFC